MVGKGTTRRSLRVPDDEWAAAQWAAEVLGVTVSDLVRDALSGAVTRARAVQPSGPSPSIGGATSRGPGTTSAGSTAPPD